MSGVGDTDIVSTPLMCESHMLEEGRIRDDFNRKTYPPEKLKALLAFLYLVISLLITVVSIIISNQRLPDRTKYPPLPDIVFEVSDRIPWGIDVAESLGLTLAVIWWIILIFHKHRFILLRRAFVLIGTLYLYRCSTFLVTALPASYKEMYCPPKSKNVWEHLRIHLLPVILKGSSKSTGLEHRMCGNYIFSGHTMFITLHTLLIGQYTSGRWWPVHWFCGFIGLSAVTGLLLAHEHYTVDVLIAYFITSRLFYWYHTLASVPELKSSSAASGSLLHRLWFYRPVCFLEKHVNGAIPAEFGLPLPYKARQAITSHIPFLRDYR